MGTLNGMELSRIGSVLDEEFSLFSRSYKCYFYTSIFSMFYPVMFCVVINEVLGNPLPEPQEVSDAVLFLLSERASMITGTILPVDGGFSAA